MNNLSIEQIKEIAEDNHLEFWLDPTPVGRGWYTCQLTGKKFRGDIARQMIADQEDILFNKHVEETTEEPQESPQEIEEGKNPSESTEAKGEPEKPQGNISTNIVPMVEVALNVNGEELKVFRTHTLDTHLRFTPVKSKGVKTTIIHCIDCGAPREIKVQDMFQVKRCPACQKAYRNAVRRAKRAEKKNSK